MKIILWLSLSALLLGFAPWESLFSIEIRSSIIGYLTSVSVGMSGISGLIVYALSKVRKRKMKAKSSMMVLLSVLLLASIFLLFIVTILPDFKWTDEDFYKNGNSFVVTEYFEGFVTSNLVPDRMVLTNSPYSAVRKIRVLQSAGAAAFRGDTLIYKGKIWIKQKSLH